MKRYEIAVYDREEKLNYTSEVDYLYAHVGVDVEGSKLINSETFISDMTQTEMMRMYLMLGRAIQASEFGHISPQVGEIVDSHLFKVRGLRAKGGIIDE